MGEREISGGHWARLDDVLRTDAADVGCDAARESLDVYAELVAAGQPAHLRFPGVAAHTRSCDQCREDLAGIVAFLSGPGPVSDAC